MNVAMVLPSEPPSAPRLRARRRLHLVPTPRPATRADCANVARPCPYVSCRLHLWPSAATRYAGPWEMPAAESCAQDVADRGPFTLQEIAGLLGSPVRKLAQSARRDRSYTALQTPAERATMRSLERLLQRTLRYLRIRYPELFRELLDQMASSHGPASLGEQLDAAAIDDLQGNDEAADPDGATWLTERDLSDVDAWTDRVLEGLRLGLTMRQAWTAANLFDEDDDS